MLVESKLVQTPAAENAWKTLKEGLLFGYQYGQGLGIGEHVALSGDKGQWGLEIGEEKLIPNPYVESFQKGMDDDFNTPTALAVLFELAKELRRQGNLLTHQGKTDTSSETIKQQWQTLVHLAQVLGLEAVLKDEYE